MNLCASQPASPPLASQHQPPSVVRLAAHVRRRVLAVGLIGPGRVGSALLAQLRTAQSRLALGGLELKLCGVAASKRMWLDSDDPELNNRCDRAQTWRPSDLDEFAAHVRGNDGRHALLIDCSASDVGGIALRRLARRRTSRHHTKQTRRQRSAGTLAGDPRRLRRRHALPLRGHRLRGPAGSADAARPARHRR